MTSSASVHPTAAEPARSPHALASLAAAPGADRARAEAAVSELLEALGQDPSGEHLADTPRRVVDGLVELLTPEPFALTTFANDGGYSELVLVRDIPFTSLCEHHMLPFRGVAHVGYMPSERIVGLSKLARVVDWFARGLQVQERLTAQIADHLQRHLDPLGVGVVLEAEHMCMSIRGVRAGGATTRTSAFRGDIAADQALRAQFSSGSR